MKVVVRGANVKVERTTDEYGVDEKPAMMLCPDRRLSNVRVFFPFV